MKTIDTLLAAAILSSTAVGQTLKEAIKQTTNEQFDNADASFKSLISKQPNIGEYYFYYGENCFKNEKLDQANAAYQKGVDMNASNPLCYVGLGKVQWYEGKQADAKANFFKATTLAKSYKYENLGSELTMTINIGKNSSVAKAKYMLNSEATVLIKIAQAYIFADTKNISEALNLLEQAIKLEPNNPDAYIARGDAYLEQNDGTKAVENYEKAAALDPNSVIATLRQGQLYNRAKNYNLALDFYKKAGDIDSTYAPAYREKAEIYFRAGQFKNATANYKRYLELNNNCSARGRYAGFLNQAKDYKASAEAALEAQKCDPENDYLNRYLAYDYLELKDYANGLNSINTFFAKANQETKIIAQDYETRGQLYSQTGKDSMAILDFQKAISMDSTRKDLQMDIANAYMKMRKYKEAINVFDQRIKSGQGNANDYYGMGRCYYYSKDFVNADSAFAQIVKSQPDLYLGYIWRAKANVQLDPKNEKWQAKPYYEAFLEKLKQEEQERAKAYLIEAYTYLGVYYMNNKDFCTAKTQFKKIMDLDATNANAKKFMDSAEAKKCP